MSEQERNEYSNRLRLQVARLKVTQARLAHLSGLTEKTVRKAMQGGSVEARSIKAIEGALRTLERLDKSRRAARQPSDSVSSSSTYPSDLPQP